MPVGLLSPSAAQLKAAAAEKARQARLAAARAKHAEQVQKRKKKCKCDPKQVQNRYGSPSEKVENGMNREPPKPKTCPLCGRTEPIPYSPPVVNKFYKQMSADHIVPCTEIMKKPGFCCLSDDKKKKVLNNRNNLTLVCAPCNLSRKATDWKDWNGHGGKMTAAGKKFAQEMAEKAPGLSKNLSAQITRLL